MLLMCNSLSTKFQQDKVCSHLSCDKWTPDHQDFCNIKCNPYSATLAEPAHQCPLLQNQADTVETENTYCAVHLIMLELECRTLDSVIENAKVLKFCTWLATKKCANTNSNAERGRFKRIWDDCQTISYQSELRSNAWRQRPK